jgi:hypothetical protein
MMTTTTNPQSGIKSSVSTASICITSSRIPASASTHQGPEKCNVVLFFDKKELNSQLSGNEVHYSACALLAT